MTDEQYDEGDSEYQEDEDTKKPAKKKSLIGEDGVIRLDLSQREIPVKLTKPRVDPTDPGEAEEIIDCVLRELSGTQRDKYLNNLGDRARTNREGKVVGMKNFDGMQANLLARCLFRRSTEGGKDVLFKENELQRFPARIQSMLFDHAKEISGMTDDAEETAGND